MVILNPHLYRKSRGDVEGPYDTDNTPKRPIYGMPTVSILHEMKKMDVVINVSFV